MNTTARASVAPGSVAGDEPVGTMRAHNAAQHAYRSDVRKYPCVPAGAAARAASRKGSRAVGIAATAPPAIAAPRNCRRVSMLRSSTAPAPTPADPDAGVRVLVPCAL